MQESGCVVNPEFYLLLIPINLTGMLCLFGLKIKDRTVKDHLRIWPLYFFRAGNLRCLLWKKDNQKGISSKLLISLPQFHITITYFQRPKLANHTIFWEQWRLQKQKRVVLSYSQGNTVCATEPQKIQIPVIPWQIETQVLRRLWTPPEKKPS